jgi:hypothetical protein
MSDEERLQEVFAELGGADNARKEIFELAEDGADQEARARMCGLYADSLARIGGLLWVGGAILGPDRRDGASPFGFGDDDVVGLAAVCQMGGELARGAVDLFEAGNLYAGSTLVRQLLEIGYLVSAFAESDKLAAEWMRANRKERQKFWSPAQLRRKSNGRHLSKDYWDHCDRGGHPTAEALDLLPDHEALPAAFLWADLAGHLYAIWSAVEKAVEVRAGRLPDDANAWFPEVAEAAAAWLEQDKFTMVLRAMHGRVRRPSDAES